MGSTYPVNPSHYADHAVSPIELMAAYGIDKPFARGNAIKYLARSAEKDGETDDQKALWYVAYLVTGSVEGAVKIIDAARAFMGVDECSHVWARKPGTGISECKLCGEMSGK